MLLETYLEILLAVQEGDHQIPTLAEAAGLSESDTQRAVAELQHNGFLGTPTGDGYPILPAGRRLLRLGCDEIFKRALTERLGGDEHSAS